MKTYHLLAVIFPLVIGKSVVNPELKSLTSDRFLDAITRASNDHKIQASITINQKKIGDDKYDWDSLILSNDPSDRSWFSGGMDVGKLNVEELKKLSEIGKANNFIGFIKQTTWKPDGTFKSAKFLTPEVEAILENGRSSLVVKNSVDSLEDLLPAQLFDTTFTKKRYDENGTLVEDTSKEFKKEFVEIVDYHNLQVEVVINLGKKVTEFLKSVPEGQLSDSILSHLITGYSGYSWRVFIDVVSPAPVETEAYVTYKYKNLAIKIYGKPKA